jgi:hypothetical protein
MGINAFKRPSSSRKASLFCSVNQNDWAYYIFRETSWPVSVVLKRTFRNEN